MKKLKLNNKEWVLIFVSITLILLSIILSITSLKESYYAGYEKGYVEGQEDYLDRVIKVLASCREADLTEEGERIISIKNVECDKYGNGELK